MSVVSPDDVVVHQDALPLPVDLSRLFGHPGTSRAAELEIGCGKGRFLVAAAGRWPERDFLAVEYSRKMVRKVRDKVVREGLANVRLLHGEAKRFIGELAPDAAFTRIHVYFPDPWPKRRHAKHRFFAGSVPRDLARVLVPGGELFFSTDHEPYFREVVARLRGVADLVGVLPDAFDDLPASGFDAIFGARGVPIFRAAWQRVK